MLLGRADAGEWGGTLGNWCRFSSFLGQSPVWLGLFAPVGGAEGILPLLAPHDPDRLRDFSRAKKPPLAVKLVRRRTGNPNFYFPGGHKELLLASSYASTGGTNVSQGYLGGVRATCGDVLHRRGSLSGVPGGLLGVRRGVSGLPRGCFRQVQQSFGGT